MIKEYNKEHIIQVCKTLTILYVEDNEDARESTKMMLNRLFKSVIVAVDGKDGLDKFKQYQNSIDIVLTDINMPIMDGIAMLQNIRDIDKQVYCIILSAHSETDFFMDSINLGIDGYLLKPIELKHFLNILGKITHHIDTKNQKEKALDMLIEQSRLAAMGEMISMIAHQWRQPLTTLAGLIANIDLRKKMNMLTDEYWNEAISNHNIKIQYLSQTIDDFMGYFNDKGIKENITIEHLINSSVRLIEDSYKELDAKIEIVYQIDKDIQIDILASKFNQVMLNLLKNALDEHKSKDTQESKTIINILLEDDILIIKIQDNAGGVPEDIIHKIFEPYFSTKDLNGTGLGLYMSKMLVEKHLDGTIEVINHNGGALFTIKINLKK
jgi:signal transduction histidine kinase